MNGLSEKLLISITIMVCSILVAGCTGSDDNMAQEDIADTGNGPQEESQANYIIVSSSAFENGSEIPEKYTCDGENVNPPIDLENLPDGTQSLVLIINDPDAPSGSFTHWLVWDIAPGSRVDENSVPGTVGTNSRGQAAYAGPCPPVTHQYQFMVFALDTQLNLPTGSDLEQVEESMQGHVLAEGQLTGRYGRS